MPSTNLVALGEGDILPGMPYPYEEDEVKRGDCILSIRRWLLASKTHPSAEDICLAHLDAQDHFKVKVDIIQRIILNFIFLKS